MDIDEYEREVCRCCDTYWECEGSNREDCKRRDDETDAKNAQEVTNE